MSTDPKKEQEPTTGKMSEDDLGTVAGGIDTQKFPTDGSDPSSPDAHHGSMRAD